MCEIQHNNADWDYFKILTLQEILKIQHQIQVEHCAYSEATHVSQKVGCARHKHVSHTAQRNQRLFLSMQVCEWTEFPRLICGIWSLMCYIQVQMGNRNSSKHGAARRFAKHQRRE